MTDFLGSVRSEVRSNQCDQMLTLKVAQIYPNVDPKSSLNRVYFKVMSFLKAQKVTKYLGYFCNKICYQELLKIAQSGHTGSNVHNICWRRSSKKIFSRARQNLPNVIEIDLCTSL